MAGFKNRLDLTGQKYGQLTVLGPTEQRKNGYTVWRCQCGCGSEILLDTRCLRRGTVTGCGYISKVKLGQRDISGMRFGKLTAVEPTGEAIRCSAVRRCECDCGGEVYAPLHQLTAAAARAAAVCNLRYTGTT